MEKNDIKFEEALSRLEEIVRELENGTAELDKSLAMFEEGVELVKLCSGKLDEAEKRINILVGNGNGGYDEKPFSDN